MQRQDRSQPQPRHSPQQHPSTMHWGLDSLTDAIMTFDPQKNQNQPGVHVVTPGNLSHQSSTNSAASSRSAQSRTSTYSIPESVPVPATVYQVQVPHTYDQPSTPTTTQQNPSTAIVGSRPRSAAPGIVVAAFGMTSIHSYVLFGYPSTDDRYESTWDVHFGSIPLTMLHFSGPAYRFRDRLRGLGSGRGITSFLVCVSMNDFNTVYVLLDAIRDCMDHHDKSWWHQVVLVFDQIETQQDHSQIERDAVRREVSRIQAHYGMHGEPAVFFISTAMDIVRHPVHGAHYRRQCRQALYDIIHNTQQCAGRWRPHVSDDEDDDDDDDDGFHPKAIRISGWR
ncbi:hypothetical protein BX666DRAFT_1917234 [Dichotomocladium elegans]|nr:hypothetical protein BX666DRAFT_1917234 [Dichotomocladium elegans]